MILVSIHDVTPALETEVRALWSLCRAYGVQPALLVVPEWHGAHHLEEAPAFVRWLRGLRDGGAEVLLHGERHDEVGTARRVRHHVGALGRTAGEGEFLALDEAQARHRITRGVERLAALGLAPIGFVPPAWLAPPALHDWVAAAGLTVSEDADAVWVHDPPFGSRRHEAPAVRWSARGVWRPVASATIAKLRWWSQRRAPLVRVALHPADLRHPVTRESVGREVARWTETQPTGRYGSLPA